MAEDMQPRWAEALERVGMSSARQLAQKANLSPSTAAKIVMGRVEKVRPATVAAIARTLGATEDDVYAIIRDSKESPRVYRGPEESATLTPYQREALDKVVHAFLRSNRENQSAPEKTTKPAAPDNSAVGPHLGPGEKTNVRPMRPQRQDRLVANKSSEPKESD